MVKGFGGAVEYSFYGDVVYIEYFRIAFSQNASGCGRG